MDGFANDLGDLPSQLYAFASHSSDLASQLEGFANHFSGSSNIWEEQLWAFAAT